MRAGIDMLRKAVAGGGTPDAAREALLREIAKRRNRVNGKFASGKVTGDEPAKGRRRAAAKAPGAPQGAAEASQAQGRPPEHLHEAAQGALAKLRKLKPGSEEHAHLLRQYEVLRTAIKGFNAPAPAAGRSRREAGPRTPRQFELAALKAGSRGEMEQLAERFEAATQEPGNTGPAWDAAWKEIKGALKGQAKAEGAETGPREQKRGGKKRRADGRAPEAPQDAAASEEAQPGEGGADQQAPGERRGGKRKAPAKDAPEAAPEKAEPAEAPAKDEPAEDPEKAEPTEAAPEKDEPAEAPAKDEPTEADDEPGPGRKLKTNPDDLTPVKARVNYWGKLLPLTEDEALTHVGHDFEGGAPSEAHAAAARELADLDEHGRERGEEGREERLRAAYAKHRVSIEGEGDADPDPAPVSDAEVIAGARSRGSTRPAPQASRIPADQLDGLADLYRLSGNTSLPLDAQVQVGRELKARLEEVSRATGHDVEALEADLRRAVLERDFGPTEGRETAGGLKEPLPDPAPEQPVTPQPATPQPVTPDAAAAQAAEVQARTEEALKAAGMAPPAEGRKGRTRLGQAAAGGPAGGEASRSGASRSGAAQSERARRGHGGREVLRRVSDVLSTVMAERNQEHLET
jgi:hypothetical protein